MRPRSKISCSDGDRWRAERLVTLDTVVGGNGAAPGGLAINPAELASCLT